MSSPSTGRTKAGISSSASGRDSNGRLMAAFPDFRPLGLEDREFIREVLWRYQPDPSELTFTNLFIWRSLFRSRWSTAGQWLLLLQEKEGDEPSLLPAVGPSPRLAVTRLALGWGRGGGGGQRPRIERGQSP